jgi:hypothetical protein
MRSPLSFYTGVGIVIATHAYMFVKLMPPAQMKYHAYLNLGGACLILYGAYE